LVIDGEAPMQLSDQDYASYIQRHARWNFAVNLADLTFYHLAMSFIFGATVLTLYASYLTSSAVLIGLVPTVQSLGFLLPQLLLSRQAEQCAHKKSLVVRISIVERLPYLWLALLILFVPQMPRGLSYAILLLSLFIGTGAGGVGAPAWKAMLSKVVPARQRSFMFGLSSALGSLLGLGGAWLSRHLLATYSYPRSFAYSFILCFAFQVVSFLCLTLNREPVRRPERAPLAAKEYWRRLPRVLGRNRNFRRYLAARALVILGTMGTAFYMIYATRRFAVPDAFAAELTMAALFSQALFTPLLGWLGDRKGNKWLLELSTMLRLASIALVFVSPGAIWLYGVFVLVYGATSAMSISGFAMSMEFCAPEDVPTFAALDGTINAIPTMLAPLLAGWLVDLGSGIGGAAGQGLGGFRIMFGVAAILTVLGYAAIRWLVKEPRHEAPGVGVSAAD
jgi:MFS family permease